MNIKNTLRLEEFIQFLACIYGFSLLPYDWWWFPLTLLLPDISMVGYLFSPRTGAFLYNLVHHKGLALAIVFSGYYFKSDLYMAMGAVLYAHSSIDRVFGYGLKYEDDFKNTHLGELK